MFSLGRFSTSIADSRSSSNYFPTLNSVRTLQTLKKIQKLTQAYQEPDFVTRKKSLASVDRSGSRSPVKILDNNHSWGLIQLPEQLSPGLPQLPKLIETQQNRRYNLDTGRTLISPRHALYRRI